MYAVLVKYVFLIFLMINDLSTPDSQIWKFVDDTTVDEIIDKNGVSTDPEHY